MVARIKAVLVLLGIALGAVVIVGGALTVVDRLGGKRDRVVVGSKAFTESIILGEIVAQWLERNGVPVERRFDLGATNISFAAIRGGAVDLYAEYTGTGLIAILHHAPVADRSRVFEIVRTEFEKEYGIEWLPPLGFDNTYALAMPAALAGRLGITKISDLRAHPDLQAGFASEFFARADGWPGLQEAYGLHFRREPSSMEAGLMYQAAKNQQLDVVSVYSTDGRIETQHLRVLDDDRGFFPPYEAAIMVRIDALAKNPRAAGLLRALAGTISGDEMRRMNADVDFGNRGAPEVARAFLANAEIKAQPSTPSSVPSSPIAP